MLGPLRQRRKLPLGQRPNGAAAVPKAAFALPSKATRSPSKLECRRLMHASHASPRPVRRSVLPVTNRWAGGMHSCLTPQFDIDGAVRVVKGAVRLFVLVLVPWSPV